MLIHQIIKKAMKSTIACLLISFPLVSALNAEDVSVTLSEVHLCCGGCVKTVEKTVAKAEGVKADVDKDARVVKLTAADAAALQKAANALLAAGYFGVSDNAEVKIAAKTGAKDETVETLAIQGLHLCCGACVKSVNKALKTVKGVEANTAEKNAEKL